MKPSPYFSLGNTRSGRKSLLMERKSHLKHMKDVSPIVDSSPPKRFQRQSTTQNFNYWGAENAQMMRPAPSTSPTPGRPASRGSRQRTPTPTQHSGEGHMEHPSSERPRAKPAGARQLRPAPFVLDMSLDSVSPDELLSSTDASDAVELFGRSFKYGFTEDEQKAYDSFVALLKSRQDNGAVLQIADDAVREAVEGQLLSQFTGMDLATAANAEVNEEAEDAGPDANSSTHAESRAPQQNPQQPEQQEHADSQVFVP